jgi:4-carboxymuconolactone decarboxylase
MHLKQPRIPPLSDAELSPEQREALLPASYPGTPPLNIFRTLAHAPDALKAFLAWGTYILRNNSLEPRQREIVILRTGYLCRSGYEWTQHVRISLRGGMSEDEIAAIKTGAQAPIWSPADAALIAACDDLHERQIRQRRNLGQTQSPFQRPPMHGYGLHRRPIHASQHDAEHVRRAAR